MLQDLLNMSQKYFFYSLNLPQVLIFFFLLFIQSQYQIHSSDILIFLKSRHFIQLQILYLIREIKLKCFL